MATKFYGTGIAKCLDGSVDWDTSTSLKCALLLSTYNTISNTQHSHTMRSDCSASEATGQTYQAIPATLAVSKVTADSMVYLDCGSSVQFTGVTASQAIGSLVVFQDRAGVAGTSELIAKLEFSGGTFTSNGQAITVNFNASGVGSIAY